MDEKIREALAKLNPTSRRIAEVFVRTHAENEALKRALENYTAQHNELYALLVAILQAGEKEILVPFDAWNTLHWSEYKVAWEEDQERGGIVVKLTHFTDEGDEQVR